MLVLLGVCCTCTAAGAAAAVSMDDAAADIQLQPPDKCSCKHCGEVLPQQVGELAWIMRQIELIHPSCSVCNSAEL